MSDVPDFWLEKLAFHLLGQMPDTREQARQVVDIMARLLVDPAAPARPKVAAWAAGCLMPIALTVPCLLMAAMIAAEAANITDFF